MPFPSIWLMIIIFCVGWSSRISEAYVIVQKNCRTVTVICGSLLTSEFHGIRAWQCQRLAFGMEADLQFGIIHLRPRKKETNIISHPVTLKIPCNEEPRHFEFLPTEYIYPPANPSGSEEPQDPKHSQRPPQNTQNAFRPSKPLPSVPDASFSATTPSMSSSMRT